MDKYQKRDIQMLHARAQSGLSAKEQVLTEAHSDSRILLTIADEMRAASDERKRRAALKSTQSEAPESVSESSTPSNIMIEIADSMKREADAVRKADR